MPELPFPYLIRVKGRNLVAVVEKIAIWPHFFFFQPRGIFPKMDISADARQESSWSMQ
jgi:hypothetical protein